jgi:hypothetical protein
MNVLANELAIVDSPGKTRRSTISSMEGIFPGELMVADPSKRKAMPAASAAAATVVDIPLLHFSNSPRRTSDGEILLDSGGRDRITHTFTHSNSFSTPPLLHRRSSSSSGSGQNGNGVLSQPLCTSCTNTPCSCSNGICAQINGGSSSGGSGIKPAMKQKPMSSSGGSSISAKQKLSTNSNGINAVSNDSINSNSNSNSNSSNGSGSHSNSSLHSLNLFSSIISAAEKGRAKAEKEPHSKSVVPPSTATNDGLMAQVSLLKQMLREETQARILLEQELAETKYVQFKHYVFCLMTLIFVCNPYRKKLESTTSELNDVKKRLEENVSC